MSETNPAAGEAPRQRRVLLVEDEELVAMAMADALERLGWTIVGPATTLDEAKAIAASDVPLDAAILDINLQGRWVHGVAEELKSRGVPFVVCSGYETVDPDGRLAGAPIVAKPIAADRLIATLDDLLASEPPQSPVAPSQG